jgi:hypothetical protein
MYKKTIQKEKKNPYVTPMIGDTCIELESSIIAASIKMRSSVEVEDWIDGGDIEITTGPIIDVYGLF